ncbi:MAG: YraN family protein [Ideonella sp.]|nr:YraN family protein [Ideonella sp.]
MGDEVTSKGVGDGAEEQALRHLLARGLSLVQRNYRVAAGPRSRGGEIDLILRERDGTLVFVEVRSRRNTRHGGAAASIGLAKQRSLVFAARHYLARLRTLPPCRFDVVAIDGAELQWLRGAIEVEGV